MKILFALFCLIASILSVRKLPKLALCLLILWGVVLIFVTILSREPTYSSQMIVDPLRAIKHFWKYRNAQGTWKYQGLEGILLNILLFVPGGYMLSAQWRCIDKWWKALMCGFLLSLTIEIVQYITSYGCFDVADIINNSFGSILGWHLLQKGR